MLLVRASQEALCFILEQDTLFSTHNIEPVQPRKTEKSPKMIEQLLTGMLRYTNK